MVVAGIWARSGPGVCVDWTARLVSSAKTTARAPRWGCSPAKQANGGEEVDGKEERKATAGRTEEGRAAEGCRLGGGGLARLGFLTRNKWRRGVG